MRLEEFVTLTLKEIIGGVVAAQKYAKEQHAKVNPGRKSYMQGPGGKLQSSPRAGEVSNLIEFDVAVSTTEGQSKKAGAGVFVAALGIGAQGQSDAVSTASSRVKFSVPIVLPVQD